jgi:hypothetical protein
MNPLLNKSLLRSIYPLVFLLLLAVILLRYFWQPGIFTAHDIENHLARVANYASALKGGQFPVRWAGNLNHKFGYPVFNYNYPLPNMLALPFLFFFSVQDSLKLVLFISYTLSGIFLYLWLKKSLGLSSAWLAAIFYLTFPYQFIDIYIRGVVGENLTLFLFPAVLYFIDLTLSSRKQHYLFFLSVTVSAFSLSHNIYVLLFTPLVFGYLIGQSYKRKHIVPAWVGVLLGMGMSAFFWLPAVLEKKYVNLSAFDPQNFYKDHFVTIGQLLSDHWQTGYSVAGTNDGMSFSLGWPALIIISVSILAILLNKRFCTNKLFVTSLILSLITLFFMTQASAGLWQIVPFIGYIQFPWRLLGLVGFFTTVCFGFLSVRWPAWVKLVVFLLIVSYSWKFTYPFGWSVKKDTEFFEFPFTTTTKHENTPIWFSEDLITEISQDKAVFTPTQDIPFTVVKKKSHYHEYEIINELPSLVIIRQAYFPGWQAFVDGTATTIQYSNPICRGLICFKADTGKHKLVLKFTENTPARIIGDLISISSLIGLLIYTIFFRDKNKK